MWSNNNVVLVLATLALCLVALAPKPTQTLSCDDCDDHDCGPLPNCTHGYVSSPCGCCTVCGKGPGEICWEFEVACAPGLECVYPESEEFIGNTGRCTLKSRPRP